MAVILITGGTGLIGTALTELLITKGYEVIILTRKPKESQQAGVSYATWNVEEQTIDKHAVARADYIVHLAGASVADKRWTENRKKEIVESRTKSGQLIVKTLRESENKVKAVISASAIGWYGDDNKRPSSIPFKEETPAHTDFLGNTSKLWEESIAPVEALAIRLVKLRIGIVLSKDGGALPEFIKPAKFGIAGILGNGKQVISWIHIDDLCRMFLYAIENEDLKGVYNAVAPAPVANKLLTITIAEKIKGKFHIPAHVPSIALRLMLGEMSVEVLKSATVSSDKILAEGFTFLYPSINNALDNLLGK